jgi:hypothetical protein
VLARAKFVFGVPKFVSNRGKLAPRAQFRGKMALGSSVPDHHFVAFLKLADTIGDR